DQVQQSIHLPPNITESKYPEPILLRHRSIVKTPGALSHDRRLLALYAFLTASIVREIKPLPKTTAEAAAAVARAAIRSMCDSSRYAKPRTISPRPPATIARPDRARHKNRKNGDDSIDEALGLRSATRFTDSPGSE